MSLQSKETHDFVRLLTSHQTAIRAFIVSMIPGSSDVEDVLQDTNVVIWEKMDTFEPGSDFHAWAFAIAKNVARAQLRKTKREHLPTLNEDIARMIEETWHRQGAPSVSREEAALDKCLSQLTPKDRAIVEARYSRTGSLESHATATGRSAGSLRVTLFRIRSKLRRCVQQRIFGKEGTA